METKIIQELKQEYPNKTNDLELLINHMDKIESSMSLAVKKEHLEEAQQIINQLWNVKETNILLELQIIINEARNKYDIIDPREVINIEGVKRFVQ